MAWAPSIHLLRLYSAFALFLLFFFPFNKFSKKGSSLKQGFPQEPTYHIFFHWMHCDVLCTRSCQDIVWSGSEQGLKSPLWLHRWSGSSGGPSVVGHVQFTPLCFWQCAHHTQTFPLENVRKMTRNKVYGGFPSFPQIIRQIQCSDQVLSFCRALFSFTATLLSLMCLWFM